MAGAGMALVVVAGAASRPGTVVVGELAADVARVPGGAAAVLSGGVAEENPGRDPRGD